MWDPFRVTVLPTVSVCREAQHTTPVVYSQWICMDSPLSSSVYVKNRSTAGLSMQSLHVLQLCYCFF